MSLRRSMAAACGAVAVLSVVSAAHAGPWGLPRGEFYTELTGHFFSSNTYLDKDGTRLSFDAAFEERALTSHTEIGWKKNTTFVMELPFVGRTVAPHAQGLPSFEYSGLGDIGLGLRFSLAQGAMPMAIEVGWTAPMGTNRNLFPGSSGSGGTDPTSWPTQAYEPLATDSSAFFNTGLQSLGARFDIGGGLRDNLFWSAGAGYRTRYFTFLARKDDDRFADFREIDAQLGWWISKEVLLTGQFSGEWQSRQGENYDRIPDSGPTQGEPELLSKNLLVGPRFTYRVDERMDVFAGSWHTWNGENVLHENYYFLGIAWKNSSLDRLAGALGGTKAPSHAKTQAPAAAPATTPPTTPSK